MKIRPAHRSATNIKLGIMGPSGSGKTIGALKLAYGLTGDWQSVCIIDTESGSSDLYAHLGSYQVLPLASPYSPERYIEAIDACEQAGHKAIVLDSISHEWEYLLQAHGRMSGNSFTNWSKITPRHNELIHRIIQSQVHIIVTIRAKQGYVLNQVNGKYVPEKVGLKGITREGLDYELTTVLKLDMQHKATVSKDRTSIFSGMPEFQLSEPIGKKIRRWCEHDTPVERTNDFQHPSGLFYDGAEPTKNGVKS